MAEYRVPYGKTDLSFTLPDSRDVTVLNPADVPGARDPHTLVAQALESPVGDVSPEMFQGVRRVAIAIPDKTRPVAHAMLYPLLEWLASLGVAAQTITFLIATGTHTPMRRDEFPLVLPHDILSHYRVFSHDCDNTDNLVYQGRTTRGTPVWTNRIFAEADLRIVVGNLEPHQFMGFTGGAKGAAIGLAGRETITTNHAMLTSPAAQPGVYDGNPLRQDVEGIGRLMGIHLALNAILNRRKEIVHVLAGEPVAVMRAGIPLLRALVEVEVPAPFDLVIASPGGFPKDINLYQAQKGLAHAARVTRTGGTVILVAACDEGTGNAAYEQWIAGVTSHQAVLERFAREPFRLGPHKAFQIARDAIRLRVLFKSEMAPDFVRSLLLEPVSDLAATVWALADALPPDARIGVLTFANATVPVLHSPA